MKQYPPRRFVLEKSVIMNCAEAVSYLNENWNRHRKVEYLSLEEHQALLAVAVEALEFYADGNHYESPGFKNNIVDDRVIDKGNVAQDALAELRGEK